MTNLSLFVLNSFVTKTLDVRLVGCKNQLNKPNPSFKNWRTMHASLSSFLHPLFFLQKCAIVCPANSLKASRGRASQAHEQVLQHEIKKPLTNRKPCRLQLK